LGELAAAKEASGAAGAANGAGLGNSLRKSRRKGSGSLSADEGAAVFLADETDVASGRRCNGEPQSLQNFAPVGLMWSQTRHWEESMENARQQNKRSQVAHVRRRARPV